MRFVTLFSLVLAGSVFADPPPAPAVRFRIIESDVAVLKQQVADLNAQQTVILTALTEIKAKLVAPAVATAQAPFTPEAVQFVSGDCPNGQCPAGFRLITPGTTVQYAAGVSSSGLAQAETPTVRTRTVARSMAQYGGTSAGYGGCGSSSGTGWYPGKKLKAAVGGLFGGCGG